MANNRLVSYELEKVFVEVIETTWDADSRKRFQAAGISTTEIFVLSPNGIPGCYMETLSIEGRIKHYFETIDFTKREDIGKLLQIVNFALRKLHSFHSSDSSGIVERSAEAFKEAGVYFNGTRLVRAISLCTGPLYAKG